MPAASLPDRPADDAGAPTVSVVIAAYNAADLIGETLESVLRQTYRDFEVIVVDDGSTDRTAEVVRGFGKAVRLIQKENGGSASARNRGIRAARGRYVAFLDADDLWLPEKLERQLQSLGQVPEAAWVYTDALFFDGASGAPMHCASQLAPLREGDVLRPLLLGSFVPFSSVMVRRSLLRASGGFDEASLHRISEDWDLWLRLAARAPLACVHAPLVRLRQHRRRKTATMDLRHARASRQAIVRKAVRRNPECLAGLEDRAQAGVLVGIGRKHLERGERREARQLFRQALRHSSVYWPAWMYLLAVHLPRPLLNAIGRLRALYRTLHQER